MDAFPWAEASWLLLFPALVAGIIGALIALNSAKSTLVAKRAFLITWGLGIVLAFLGGIVKNTVHPGREYSGFLPLMYAILEVPISLVMGGLVAAACGIVINLRNSGTTGDSVPSPANIVIPKRHAEPAYPKDSMAEQLRQTYASMDDEELVELSARGTLTETAQKVIDAELRARNG